jgi:hypothetical protein
MLRATSVSLSGQRGTESPVRRNLGTSPLIAHVIAALLFEGRPMLDAEPAFLTKHGKVTIDTGRIMIEGFDAHNGTCRDVAALAIVWAIGQLQHELMQTLERPGGGNVCVG